MRDRALQSRRLCRWGAALLILGALGIPRPLYSQGKTDFIEVDYEDGIRVFRRDVSEDGMPHFRGEALLPAPASIIVAVLKQVHRHTEWMHRCSASEIIEQPSDDHAIIYNRTDLPWPVWDRDVVLDTLFTWSTDRRTVTLTFNDTNPSLRPAPERVVRMPRLRGFYRMRQISPTHTHVVYQVEADVGGSVPRWMAQIVARDMPYETLSRLRERVRGTGRQR